MIQWWNTGQSGLWTKIGSNWKPSILVCEPIIDTRSGLCMSLLSLAFLLGLVSVSSLIHSW
ncbi:hypothetical protein BDV39DRAFT_178722 [Aspergillus sergii]|uniref:Uncharacterized protein n=1 Tax=Aspergillus sergii TaxID=1034303 RepID=A0A5N6WZR6_9EURO|nr:hypothetical protein BDV39DRAFT_178722 [Aspergillus sergii]